MSPKKPQEPNPDQGLLISATHESSGPYAIGLGKAILEVHTEGIYPEQVETAEGEVSAEVVAVEAISEAVKTANRRRAQEDKHSPLARDGDYTRLELGDFLPGLPGQKPFGPVKERNWEAAKAHARKLEAARRRKAYQNPTLDDVTVDDVRRVLTGQKDEPVKVAAKPTASGDTLPRLVRMQDRLNAAMEGAEQSVEAKVVPMSKQETTTMLALNDHISRAEAAGRPLRGTTHTYLMETYDHTVGLVRNIKHYPKVVADWYADRAFASRAYEFVDYFEDAAQSVNALSEFAAIMGDALNPTLKKAALKGEYHPAMGVLVGYLTVAKLEAGKLTEDDVPFAPLTHQESREVRMMELPTPTSKYGAMMTPEVLEARKQAIVKEVKTASGSHTDEARYGRNKTIIMPFTNPELSAEAKQFIQQTLASIPVGQIDGLIRTVQTASEARQEYWRERLEDIGGKYRKLVTPSLEKYPRSAKLQ